MLAAIAMSTKHDSGPIPQTAFGLFNSKVLLTDGVTKSLQTGQNIKMLRIPQMAGSGKTIATFGLIQAGLIGYSLLGAGLANKLLTLWGPYPSPRLIAVRDLGAFLFVLPLAWTCLTAITVNREVPSETAETLAAIAGVLITIGLAVLALWTTLYVLMFSMPFF